MTTVLTGTSIVPPPEFSLQEGDIVSITIEGVGTLENPAVFV
jgi:2-dehydro-3-deoxy-D-arabinonate dehydratase